MITDLPTWKNLQQHYEDLKDVHLKELFEKDATRAEKFSIEFGDIFLDYSKNRITQETLALFLSLLDQIKLPEKIQAMFSGEKINKTENLPVLHTALRNISDAPVLVDGIDIMPEVNRVLDKMRNFSNKIRSGEWVGFTGKRIKNVIHIGIGGSQHGPQMAYEALKPYADRKIHLRFISNIDGTHFAEATQDSNPEETLFVICSKSFTTPEPIENAHTAKKWLLDALKDKSAVSKHFIAISTNVAEVTKFGIDPGNIFEMWDWVGGRYSLCSAIGLSLMIAIGPENFDDMRKGFSLMDNHFRTSSLDVNIPVILAILGVWYNNFFNAQTHAILPYDEYLRFFPDYFQQGDMESNGKSVTLEGELVDYQTGPIVWGKPGSVNQHTFFQLLHQGTKLIPSDFIGFVTSQNPIGEHHMKLMANFFAQTQALAFGKPNNQNAPYKNIPGNKPTNTILASKLTPAVLGQLIAMYEHKIFVQGVIWNINSFDQFGVELGKIMASQILEDITQNNKNDLAYDCSTNQLIKRFLDQAQKG